MLKMLSYLVIREDMTIDEFIEYYENRHVPLILSLAPAPVVYKRRYLMRGDTLNVGEADVDFDVVTEQVFGDRAEFQSWIAAVTTGEAGERVASDEARFLDRSRTRACVVSECVTSG